MVRVELQTETQILVNEDRKMKKGLILAVAILILLALAARAQESRREVSVVWHGRTVTSGRGETDSGLRFDAVLPKDPRQ